MAPATGEHGMPGPARPGPVGLTARRVSLLDIICPVIRNLDQMAADGPGGSSHMFSASETVRIGRGGTGSTSIDCAGENTLPDRDNTTREMARGSGAFRPV